MARKILLADDSVTAQNMGRKILADAGYDVVTVNNGSAALKRIPEVKPDLIVLDVYMPGYSGLEVCQRLKDAAETAHIPVLLTVGKLEPFKPEEARRVRADAHIVKPFEASELLTAITRLEDRMVPQQSDGSRFSNSVSGVERFSGDGGSRKSEGDGDTDTGWKSRLRFPSKKKKEEPEPEPEEVVAEATFRDFRKGKGKDKDKDRDLPQAGKAFTVKAPAPPGQEPGLVPDIPRDITPDELDALSALAAKLDGPIPEAEDITALADPMAENSMAEKAIAVASAVAAPPTTQSETAATVVEAPAEVKREDEVKSAEVKKDEVKREKESEAAAAVAESASLHVDAPKAEAIALPVEERSEPPKVEIPIEHIEPAVENEEVNKEVESNEKVAVEAPAIVATDTALLAQDPAPTDQSEEPRFAAVPSAIEATSEPKIELPQAEVKQVEAVATETVATAASEQTVTTAPATSEVQTPAQPHESKSPNFEEAQGAQSADSGGAMTEQAAPAAAVVGPTNGATNQPAAPEAEAEAEEPAPSDEELAEALRLLTPETGSPETTTLPSHGTLVAAGQLLAEEAARNAAAGPRWVAEPVALSPEEAAMSLEAEMFRTFATTPIATTPIAATSEVSAAQNQRTETADVPALTVTSAVTGAVVDHASSGDISPAIASEKTRAAEQAASETQEEVASATFADAVSRNDEDTDKQNSASLETTPAQSAVASTSVDETIAAVTTVMAETQVSSSDSGGEEMGKDKKSTWHQIRTTPASTGTTKNSIEEAKLAHDADEAPKAMAAAAAADTSAFGSATDAGTIASIVDSVMADLRPKIVEEIAKKLAGK